MERAVHKNTNSTHRGFTIVELLVVIIAIGILAAISVIAYNGIQRRAQTAAYVIAADQGEKQVRLARTFDPSISTEVFNDLGEAMGWVTSACLGSMSDFPAEGEFAEGECMFMKDADGEKVHSVMVNTHFANALKNADSGFTASKLPTARMKLVGTEYVGRGLVFMSNGPSEGILSWISPDHSSCGRGSSNTGDMDIREMLQQLYAMRDGEIPNSEGDEEIPMDLINALILIYEDMLNGGRMCQLRLDLN